MSIFYIDPINGNDSYTGADWANAWKTIKTGATTARISPGDFIRIAKSPNPVSIGNATWTNKSKTVTLADAVTENIDLCASAWTASTNVTASLQTSARKEGAQNVQLAIAAAFVSGKVGYRALGSIFDFSAYQQMSLWFRTNLAIAEGVFKVCLCSDTTGDVIIDEFFIPVIETAIINSWIPITISKGSALGSSIQSIAIYTVSDPGTVTIQFDNILACYASSSNNALSLTSLISKNSAASGGTEGWYPIQSINGTTVLLDNATSTTATVGRGYAGITETVTTYRREGFQIGTSTDNVIQDSGISGSLIEFIGGWNTATNERDGETFYDMKCTVGIGLDFNSKSYVKSSYINLIRGATNVGLQSASYCEVVAHTLVGAATQNLLLYATNFCIITITNILNGGTSNIVFSTTLCSGNIVTVTNVDNAITYGISFTVATYNKFFIENVRNSGSDNIILGNSTYNNLLKITNNKDCAGYGVDFVNLSKDNYIIGMTTSDNTSGAITHPSLGNNYLRKCSLGESSKVSSQVAYGNSRLFQEFADGLTENNYIYTDGGIINSQTAIRNTASGVAWKLSPTSSNRNVGYPLILPILQLAVKANAQVTVSAWFRRSNTGIVGKLFCRGYQIAGVDSDVVDLADASQDMWERLTIQFTPTESGVVQIEAHAYGGTTYSVYVDDITYSQA